jgi:ComF family protein
MKMPAKTILSDFFFPERCLICGGVIKPGEVIFGECMKSAEIIPRPKCPLCGMPANLCSCGAGGKFYTAVTSPFYYEGKIRNAVRRWKFDGETDITAFWASAVASAVTEDFPAVKFDAVTFVPQTEKEMSERKYNQSEILAEYVSRILNVPCKSLLVKTRETEKQRTVPEFMKKGNVFGSFAFSGGGRYACVLLVDDIVTTSCTIDECAKILRMNGVNAVFCASIAMAKADAPFKV